MSTTQAAEPTLDELTERYPQLWSTVQREVGAALAADGPEGLVRLVQRAARVRGPVPAPIAAEREARRRMLVEAIRRVSLAAATGRTEGTVRFRRFDGALAQRLLFEHGLERKPVSMFWFRLLWPLVRQRRYLMPLVQPQGIYCFYSARLIRRLHELIDGRRCIEIAAGDGTLSRFLRGAGADVTATDDHSWDTRIDYADDVVCLDAREALHRCRPEVVLCSWPPAGNPFERHVFMTPSVQLYIVIGSRAEYAAGDWDAYRGQDAFTLAEAPELSRLVLPPELDSAVYLFRRRADA